MTAIVNKYGKVIVLEDDLVTNRYFLLFMNDGLDRYQNEQKVTGITGFSHFGDTFSYPCESYFNTLRHKLVVGDLERPLEVFRCGLRRLDGYGFR